MKKRYSTPTLTVHGPAVARTLGYGSKFIELIGWYNRRW